MKHFYKGGRGLCLPDQNVETLHRVSARRDTTSLRPNQRNQDTPQYIIGDIRRGAPMCAPNTTPGRKGQTHRSAPIWTVLILIFICCLFNNEALAQSRDTLGAVDGVGEISKSKERMIQRVVKKSFDNFILPEGGIVIGDDLPETFWNLSLTVTNHSSRLLSLKHRKREFMIIEFWSSGCPSCITMIDSLHRLQAQFGDLITVLPINIFDRPEKAKATIEERGWTLPVAITYGDSILNRLFLTRYDFRQIWIKDGKLIAIPTKEMVNERVISDILTNRPVHIEMKDRFTYFDRRLSNGKGRKDGDDE